jgi:hypothetical protein
MDDDKLLKAIGYGIEALLIGWLTYLFAYQNYLLYHWHRGLKLPSKLPFVIVGVLTALLFFAYEFYKLEKDSKRRVSTATTSREASFQEENAEENAGLSTLANMGDSGTRE